MNGKGEHGLRPGPEVWAYAFILLLASLGALILFCFEPGRSRIYPICLFHTATGLWCPGCGALRAMHQLLHGHLVAALRFNALFVLLLPALFLLALRSLMAAFAGKPMNPGVRPAWLWLALCVILVFGVLRNLPFAAGLLAGGS